MSLTQSGVSQAFAMSVPVYLDLKDKWYLMGFVHVSGPRTVTGSVMLPVRPDKVAIDENHSLLAVEKQ
ncbi:MAG: hypothetical protein ACRD11_16035 [Terriglobia bacterium]